MIVGDLIGPSWKFRIWIWISPKFFIGNLKDPNSPGLCQPCSIDDVRPFKSILSEQITDHHSEWMHPDTSSPGAQLPMPQPVSILQEHDMGNDGLLEH